MLAVPYSWVEATGKVTGQLQGITRSGLADFRLQLSVLVLGAPAFNIAEILKSPKKTLLGISLNINAPTEQYFSDKFINIGTYRWSFKPEIALSLPFRKRWLMDIYAGTWFFTSNQSFFPGSAIRS